jgi:hypothetical protein
VDLQEAGQSEQEEEEAEVEESENDEEEEEIEKTTTKSSIVEKSKAYDEPYFLTPTMSIFTTIFLMAVAKKFDALSPIAVRVSR